ncbi:alpha/beta fold hydrolase [Bacillus sp. Marseille-Q1617]|uniref:alpha/beta fold hydrolase n=1 Tax=Bacillus sp. Marseille-Q1617 TaxID=2736887 RepID=UPI00158DFED7|nr:alpha/beta hydrolase [Bacillus sp. Marseille-Q1617]
MAGWVRKRDFSIGDKGIDCIDRLIIGGVSQSILIQGESIDRPVLLFIHVGPSMPLPGVSSRGQDYTIATTTKELVKHYILVFWDQRGTGKSYSADVSSESIHLEQFIRDAYELTQYLKKKFNRKKVFLAAHSFGSLIGIHLAKRFPEEYHSYVGISQIISWTDNDRLALQWAKLEAEKRENIKAINELNDIGEPPYTESYKQWSVLRKWQTKFNSLIYKGDRLKHPGFAKIMWRMISSQDYSLLDVYNTLYKSFKLTYTDTFIKDLPNINCRNSVQNLKIPVTFIHGMKDVHVFGSLVEEYVESLIAEKGKKMIQLEKSAHLFHPDDCRKIEQLLIEEKEHLFRSL